MSADIWGAIVDAHDGSPPVAVTMERAAELLGVPLAAVAAAAPRVPTFTHADGTPRWSLASIAVALGLARRRRNGQGIASPSLALDAVGSGSRHRRPGPRLADRRARRDRVAVEHLHEADQGGLVDLAEPGPAGLGQGLGVDTPAAAAGLGGQ